MKNKQYYYFDEKSEMSLINNFKNWLTDNGEGDALWRTGIAYITTSEEKYKKGIMRAFTKVFTTHYQDSNKSDKYYYQATRFNDGSKFFKDDVSRDQVILAWTSLFFNKDFDELAELVNNTKYRLSKRYLMTPTMWLWSRGLIGKTFLGILGQLALMFELSISVIWNKLLYSIIGVKHYTQDELESMLEERGESIRFDCLSGEIKQMLWKMDFPGYGLHLAAWMNYTSKNTFLKKINNWLIKQDMHKGNLLLSLLIGKEVSFLEIEKFKPMEEWAWSTRMTKCTRQRLLPETFGNELDKEILSSVKMHNIYN